MSRLIEFDGQVKKITKWCDEYGIDQSRVHWRLKKGWSIKDALTKPVRRMPKRLPQSIRKQKQTMRVKRKQKNRKYGNRG